MLFFKKMLVIFIIVTLLLSLKVNFCYADSNNAGVNKIIDYSPENTYEKYLEKFKDSAEPDLEIILKGTSFSNEKNAGLETPADFQGEKDVIKLSSKSGWVEWDVDIPETGLYSMSMMYFPLEDKGGNIELELSVDGEVPFSTANAFEFCRVWKDASNIVEDSRGNDLKPKQIEMPIWHEDDFKNSEGLNESCKFYFSSGKHKLRITCTKEALIIKYIKIYCKKEKPNYEQVLDNYKKSEYKATENVTIKIQAEEPFLKSDASLCPIFDRSSPATEPYSYSKIRLNTIGGVYWKYPGQWITWKFDVPEDGLYKIGLKARQNILLGLDTTRKIYIDGEVPFKEMENVKFPYSSEWYIKVLGDKEPYLFYIKKGTHEITMEVSLGETAQTLKIISENVYKLNYWYRKIIMITGVNPDVYRDYNLDVEVPDLIQGFKEISSALSDESQRIKKSTGKKGSEAVILDRMVRQLDSLSVRPDTINERLNDFKANTGSLAAWILRLKEQSLELDYLTVLSPEEQLPKAKAGLLKSIWYNIMTFVSSFTEDYNSISDIKEDGKSIDVWVGGGRDEGQVINGGRDQSQIIKEMINDSFTPETGIQINLKLVQTDLVSAAIAGVAPDVAMTVPRGQPVNLAARNALVDLSEFKDFKLITDRFAKSAMIPYKYSNGYFGLPVDQSFHMMFYRKDVFEELGITVPQTWDDFYKIIPILEGNNMEIGLPYQKMDVARMMDAGVVARNLFSTLLLQKGESFYKEDNSSTTFDKSASIKAFQEWSDFYTRYSFPLVYDFYNHFRTGEMPLCINSYTEYNLLKTSAPEIKNLWGMAPIPGTLMPDGKINRAEGASGSACVILKGTRDKEAAWEFIKWWTSAEIQARYGRELETLMGVSARYNTANLEAFKLLPWSSEEYEALITQWDQVQEIPEIPGGYYVTRSLDNAFLKVIIDGMNPREALFKYNQDINKEIKRKRQEFGLEKK